MTAVDRALVKAHTLSTLIQAAHDVDLVAGIRNRDTGHAESEARLRLYLALRTVITELGSCM